MKLICRYRGFFIDTQEKNVSYWKTLDAKDADQIINFFQSYDWKKEILQVSAFLKKSDEVSMHDFYEPAIGLDADGKEDLYIGIADKDIYLVNLMDSSLAEFGTSTATREETEKMIRLFCEGNYKEIIKIIHEINAPGRPTGKNRTIMNERESRTEKVSNVRNTTLLVLSFIYILIIFIVSRISEDLGRNLSIAILVGSTVIALALYFWIEKKNKSI